jgi:hypothetical protein
VVRTAEGGRHAAAPDDPHDTDADDTAAEEPARVPAAVAAAVGTPTVSTRWTEDDETWRASIQARIDGGNPDDPVPWPVTARWMRNHCNGMGADRARRIIAALKPPPPVEDDPTDDVVEARSA